MCTNTPHTHTDTHTHSYIQLKYFFCAFQLTDIAKVKKNKKTKCLSVLKIEYMCTGS